MAKKKSGGNNVYGVLGWVLLIIWLIIFWLHASATITLDYSVLIAFNVLLCSLSLVIGIASKIIEKSKTSSTILIVVSIIFLLFALLSYYPGKVIFG